MLYNPLEENQENAETAEPSGSTGSSTDSSAGGSTCGSTTPVEPVQPIEVPEIQDANLDEVSLMPDGSVEAGTSQKKYVITDWTYEEMKKLIPKKTRQKISKFYLISRKPSLHKPEQVSEAEVFFETEFPRRSPYAVYQKAMKFNRKKITRIILL